MADVERVEIPTGVNLDYSSAAYEDYEDLGLSEVSATCFVLVAGGLGERLGFSGIKLALPVDLASGECYLGAYCASILALQRASGSASFIPLVIMTSDDTHGRTVELLEQHAYFGMAEGQVRLVKQEKVAALTDNDASMVLDESGLELITKPHGHGDVRSTLFLNTDYRPQ
jgi:UDP-sugar pyrophosphorylase